MVFLFLFSQSISGKDPQKNKIEKRDSTELISSFSSFKLQQNYPNPFNPTTIIEFTIPVETHVKLIVYNMLGNEVATLMDGVKPAGNYTVKFNGSSLSSGVYLYRLQTDYFTATKKLTLIK
jgi:hypothetical protein